MPSSLHRRRIIAVNLIITMLLTTLRPKRCHGLHFFHPSTKRLLTHHHHHRGRILSLRRQGAISNSCRRGISSLLSNDYSLNCHLGGRCISNYPPRSAITKLYSNNSSSDGTTNHAIGKAASSFLKQHLAQLEYDGKLSTDDVTSITDSLMILLEDETALNNTMVANFASVLQTSIELFMAQKESRIRANARAIENVGGYVRAIVRNQLDGNNSVGNNHGVDSAKQQQQQQQPNDTSNGNGSIHTFLESFIQSDQMNQNELNETCLQTLSQTSTDMAQYALEAYIRQKQRRVAKDMAPILDPSSYVLKILRNAPRDAPKHNQPLSERGAASTTAATAAAVQQQSPTRTNDQDNIPRMPIPITPPPAATTATKSNPTSTVTMSHVDATLSHLHKLNQPISTIKGVGPKTEAAFHKLGLFTLRDLLWHFPRSFVDRSTLQSDIRNVPEGEIGTLRLTVGKDAVKGTTIICMDESGNNVDVTFFYGRSRRGMLMATNELKKICNYHSIIVSGKVQHSRKSSTIFNPDKCVSVDQAETVVGIEPVYALSSGLRKSVLLNAIHEALQVAKELFECIPESLSDEALEVLSWPKLVDALAITHQPTSIAESGPNSPARERLAFEELCIQQAQLALMRWNLKYNNVQSRKHQQRLPTSWNDSPLVASAVEALPFQLTQSQQDCLAEMWSDAIVDTSSRMVRLLQGEVGSGKTVLAYLMALGCIETRQGGGRVAAILAPTQLLAHQHAASISNFVSALEDRTDHSSSIRNIRVEILTGAVTGKRRDELFQRLEAKSDDDAVILIGTHALVTADIVDRLQQLPPVSSDSSKGLALSVVDEEQRFGVIQREALSSCAANALFMSATPIPRTFRLKGRSGLMDYTQLVAEKSRTVKTTIASAEEMDRVVSALKSKISLGSKCFWVLPRIGDSEGDDPVSQQASVESRYQALVDIFGEHKVGFVHGRMKIEDRKEQLATFADEMSDMVILVGTTVIEVGIDIPNVNLLIIEQAERFGLSQLHQLRGRIGRNGSRDNLECHCLLLTDATKTDDSVLTRLEILRETMDGAAIAEADLMLRGAGDMLGFVQSGIKSGYVVDPTYHWELIPAATSLGRSFLHHFDQVNRDERNEDIHYDESTNGMHKSNKILHLHREGKVKALYDETTASSESGFALRVMMLLFGERNCDNLKESLQQLATLKGDSLSRNDNLIGNKVLEIVEGGIISPEMSHRSVKTTSSSSSTGSPKPVASLKPRILTTRKNAINLLDDVCFILLDVETTGLDASTSHVIQLAGKELGSSSEEEFAEYILPPVEVPQIIEEITGITDDFLRSGEFKVFNEVYLEFQDFCTQQANGREVCFVAHNAKFDIGMIESELRRWRTVDKAAPVLADVFVASLDTLALFKERRLWTASNVRPSSFKLGNIYYHVFSENMTNAHNAVGDVRALERLLLSNHFPNWKSVGNAIQQPFIKVT